MCMRKKKKRNDLKSGKFVLNSGNNDFPFISVNWA